ncbi:MULTISPECIES: DUF3842 family protein [Caloramator]|uniref:DUF3842 family protein n=1 Tax=Caloramator proteoclasticus DSM 10124 TaxID=1121262 RepID=A0A1M4U637_9CLOT|nr:MULTISPECIES: DUF3842 family protein [Caloramator]SHE52199.1 protein of unknown function [Caloramator proteoclasticus DSM 10124]
MIVAVVDGQGAGIGQAVIKKIKKEFEDKVKVVALGLNKTALKNMLKSGAEEGIIGSKNISEYILNNQINFIIGPIGILCAGGICGEVTSTVSKAIFNSPATKLIIPLQKHGIYIPNTQDLSIKECIEVFIEKIREQI